MKTGRPVKLTGNEIDDLRRKKRAARHLLHYYVGLGRIKRLPCQGVVEHCGDPAEAHHNDYDYPLEVIWLCRRHHFEMHSYLKELRPIDPKILSRVRRYI